MNNRDTEFVAHLTNEGRLSQAGLDRAAAACRASGVYIEQALVELGLMQEEELASILAELLEVPLIEVQDFDLSGVGKTVFDLDFLKRSMIAPVTGEMDEGMLWFALADPRDTELINLLEFYFGCDVKVCVATSSTILSVLESAFGAADKIIDDSDEIDADINRLAALANEGPVVKLVQELIAKAIDFGASDIHIEAQELKSYVRYRVDGGLRKDRALSGSDRGTVVSRLKIMANLNISEMRRPQDGRIRSNVRGRNIDLRLSTLPTQFGESVVLRVLDQSRLKLDWHALGFDQDRVDQLNRLIQSPNGIVLVTGPTGSGKTTTLYTALAQLNSDDRKIVTIEDPIEYSLQGVNQVQVHPDIGLSFGMALRAVLRQDPDVVLVGEIRDKETAENAVRAALMGRLVLSTVHTNSAIGAITRLTDLGVPSFLLAATLRGILSQRLIRRLCPKCAGSGCTTCGNSGYSGRLVASELLELNRELLQAIDIGKKESELLLLAKSQDFETIQENTAKLIQQGHTSEREAYKSVGVI